MKQQWWYKQISYGTVVYAVLFLIDYIHTLFQMAKSGVRVTLLGLKIDSVMTKNSINTNFSLTLKTLITYIIFIGLWLLLAWGIKKFRSNKSLA